MRSRKKVLIIFVSIVLLLGTLVACSGGKNNGNTSPGTTGEGSNGEANNSESTGLNLVNGKIEPAVTLTTVRGEDPTAAFKNGESYSDNVHIRWAREALGVNIETLWTAPLADGSFNTKLKLMLSSGDALPDVFVSTDSITTNMFIESGKVMDVGEAFEKYASDTWKEAMASVPEAWHPFMRDGKKFAIPIIEEALAGRSALWIRQDWLDALDLKAPTTLEELEAVMDAFANGDPDQNGEKDTIALDFGMKDAFIGYPVGDVSWIFGMFGAIPEIWYPGADGQLQYGSIQPEIKQALAKLSEWKEKGYIEEDIALHDFNKVAQNVASGKVGIVGGAYWFMVYPGSLMMANDPTAMYVPYPLPAGVDGSIMRRTDNAYRGGILISKDISEESLQAFFHYMNHLYESYNTDDPFYLKGYQEGYDYVIKDGNAVFDADEIPGGRIETMKYTLTGGFAIHPARLLEIDLKMARGEVLTNEDLAARATTGLIGGMETLGPLEHFSKQAALVIHSQTDADVPNYFQGPPTKTMTTRLELLNKMQMDTFTEIIYGKQSADTFDEFVEKWKSSGGDAITKEVNEWYDSVKNAN